MLMVIHGGKIMKTRWKIAMHVFGIDIGMEMHSMQPVDLRAMPQNEAGLGLTSILCVFGVHK